MCIRDRLGGARGGGSFPLLDFSTSSQNDHNNSGGNNAHMYYTSGTTGNPKGVMLTHDIVSKHAWATCAEMRLNRTDVWAHVAPMFHLVDAFAIYAVTLVGGRHVTAGLPRRGSIYS